MRSVSMITAVEGYCESHGVLVGPKDGRKRKTSQHVQALLADLSDDALTQLVEEIAEMDRSGVASDRILDLLERIEIMQRCERILPGL